MARPERNSVDYFPFMCEEGNKMFYIEQTYGNDGFAVFVKLLRELARTEYHYLNLSKPSTLMYLSAKCRVTKEVLEAIINDLVDLGKFNPELWNENRIIWCQDFIDSVQDAYKKRNNKCITFDGLLTLLDGLGIRKQSNGKPKAPVNPQSKVKYSKEEKIKENNINNSDFAFECLNSHQWRETISMQQKIKPDLMAKVLKDFEAHLISIGSQKKDVSEFKSHFSNWIPKQDYSKKLNGTPATNNPVL